MRKIRKTYKDVINECVNLHDFYKQNNINEANSPNYEDVIDKINNNDFIKNDYNSFSQELKDNHHACFLTRYSPEEMKANGTETYQVNGYPIGFALHKDDDDGEVDIVGVHNNSDVRNIADILLNKAIEFGGTKLDHFDGKLSDIYGRNGFEEYNRWKFDDNFSPSDWDYEKYGRPDVVFRKLKNRLTERILTEMIAKTIKKYLK